MENRSNGRERERAEAHSLAINRMSPGGSFKSVNWGRLFGYLKPYRGRMTLAILALLGFQRIRPGLPARHRASADPVTKSQNFGPLNNLALLLGGIFLLQAAFSFIQTYLLAYIGEHIVYDLRTTLYDHLQSLSLDFYANRRVGDIVSRSLQRRDPDAHHADHQFHHPAQPGCHPGRRHRDRHNVECPPDVIHPGGHPGLAVGRLPVRQPHPKGSTRVQDQLADSTVVAEEGLQGIRVVKSFGREDYETQRYDTAMEKTFQASLKMAVYNSAFGSIMMFLGFGSIAAVMWYGGHEVIAGRLTLATITGFLMYFITIAGSLAGLAGLYGQLRAALGGIQRVFEIIDTQPSVQDAPDAITLPASEGRINFKNVSFSYENDTPVIQDISLDIQPGEILALVGPSGAGKSTIFNLIPRFYDPTDGVIEIDGHDLRSITQESLHAQMAIVPQETLLFGGSIRENILYGKLDASEEEIIAAAKAANAHDFIMEFSQQYETLVGERGTKLSGGQRQRIAIARAILKDPRILLLDEATSSLDNESEGLVQEALNRLMQNRTTVIIAHRLSTIKVAHRIAVLDSGRIVEFGTHQELMEHNGMYAHLYLMQFRDPEEELAAYRTAHAAHEEENKEPQARPGLLDVLLKRS